MKLRPARSGGKLPDIFRPLLWGYDYASIDPARHRALIVQQALNYGCLNHWRWIHEHYGKDGIREVMSRTPVTAVRKGVRRLMALLFGFSEDIFRHAPRGTH